MATLGVTTAFVRLTETGVLSDARIVESYWTEIEKNGTMTQNQNSPFESVHLAQLVTGHVDLSVRRRMCIEPLLLGVKMYHRTRGVLYSPMLSVQPPDGRCKLRPEDPRQRNLRLLQHSNSGPRRGPSRSFLRLPPLSA